MSTRGLIFAIGGLRLTGYGLIMALGLLLGYIIASQQARHRRIRPSALNKVCFYAILFGLIVGRIIYVISNIGFYGQYVGAILRIWEGGVSTLGVVAGAVLGTFVGAGKRGFKRALDTLIPGMLLALAVCRLGELTTWQGRGMTISGNIVFPIAISNSQGKLCLAVCIYEAVAALLIMVRAIAIRGKPSGRSGLTSLMLLGLMQVPLESMRSDDFLAIGFVKMDQLIGMLMAVTIISIFLRGHLRAQKSTPFGIAAFAITIVMVVMCVLEEFKIDDSANLLLNYLMLLIYVSVMAACGLYLNVGWRAAQVQGSGNTSRVGNHRPNSTYYPERYGAAAHAQRAQQTAAAPQYSRRVDEYRQSQVTRRSR